MKLLVITGQTATGKTKLAVEKAKKENGELVNADATQIYKELDVVTGKDLDDIDDVPIHLLSILDPKQPFSSHEWVKLAKKIMDEISARNKLPIIVGGTYFYISHLLYGIETEGIGPDWELRRKLEKKSIPQLQKILREKSVAIFEKLNSSDKQNPRRLIRKIELAQREFEIEQTKQFGIDIENVELIGLRFNNKERQLKEIRARVEKRIKGGAIEEVKDLLSRGYEVTNPGLRANATFEIAQYLHGEISLEELKGKWVTLDFHYSKRQYTLMKKDPNIQWIDV